MFISTQRPFTDYSLRLGTEHSVRHKDDSHLTPFLQASPSGEIQLIPNRSRVAGATSLRILGREALYPEADRRREEPAGIRKGLGKGVEV